MTTKVVRLSVHGEIAVGKSTLIERATKIFNGRIRVIGIGEPIDAWERSGILRCVIQNTAKWGTTAQYAMAAMRCSYAEINEQDLVEPAVQSGKYDVVVVLYERTMVDDREIFARYAINDEMHWKLYEQIAGMLSEDHFGSVVRMIYLRNSVEACMRHIKERNRDGEDGYTVEQITDLHERHEKMIERQRAKGVDVQTVEYTDGAHNDDALIRSIIMDAVRKYAGNTMCTGDKTAPQS